MLAWKKIMGEFEVGHWMGAKKRGGWNAGYRNFEKGLEKKNAPTFGKWRQKKTIGKIK